MAPRRLTGNQSPPRTIDSSSCLETAFRSADDAIVQECDSNYFAALSVGADLLLTGIWAAGIDNHSTVLTEAIGLSTSLGLGVTNIDVSRK